MNEETLNRTPKEIEEMYCTLRESIRNYISRFLEDNHATDANPYDCGISLDFGACGLSDLEKPLIESIFKDDDGSGMIWCNVDWNPEPIDFDLSREGTHPDCITCKGFNMVKMYSR